MAITRVALVNTNRNTSSTLKSPFKGTKSNQTAPDTYQGRKKLCDDNMKPENPFNAELYLSCKSEGFER